MKSIQKIMLMVVLVVVSGVHAMDVVAPSAELAKGMNVQSDGQVAPRRPNQNMLEFWVMENCVELPFAQSQDKDGNRVHCLEVWQR